MKYKASQFKLLYPDLIVVEIEALASKRQHLYNTAQHCGWPLKVSSKIIILSMRLMSMLCTQAIISKCGFLRAPPYLDPESLTSDLQGTAFQTKGDKKSSSVNVNIPISPRHPIRGFP